MVIRFNDLGVLFVIICVPVVGKIVLSIGHSLLQGVAGRELLAGFAILRPVDESEFVHGFWFRGF